VVEIGMVPTAGAVANALYQFDGIRRTKLPMKKKEIITVNNLFPPLEGD